MTTANKVTILRILLIPVFVVEIMYYVNTNNEWHRLIALICFALASICDGVDGYIARHYNQRSELGAILDPLADKLLLVSAIIFFSFRHKAFESPAEPGQAAIPVWVTGTIIGRDILLLAGLLVIQLTVGKISVHPRLIGKIATVLQMGLVLWILLRFPYPYLPAWRLAAALATGISGLLYIWDGSSQLSAHPSSSPGKVERGSKG